MSVRRLDEIAGRSPDSPARRSRVAKRAPLCGGRRSSRRGREAAWQIWSGSPDWRRKGGVGVVTAVGDSGRLFGPASTSGWMPGGSGRVEVRIHSTARYAPLQGPHPLRIVRRGAWKPSERDSTPVERQVAVSVRRPHGTTRRSPTHSPGGAAWQSAPALRGTPVESARPLQAREAAWQIRSGFPASGGRAGGRCTKAVPGWDGFRRQFVVDDFDFRLDAGGLREGRGPHPLDGALCSDPRAVSSTTRAKGCLETQPKGTRLRSSGRLSGVCPAAPRDYQAQSQLTCSAERRVAKRARCAGDAGRRAGTGSADRSSRGTSTSGRTPGAPGRSRSASTRRRAMLRPKGRILYDRAKGCLETQPKGTRLRSSGRSSGACPAAPRDYQAQSQLTSSATEPSCEMRRPCGTRGRSRANRSGGPHPAENAGGRRGDTERFLPEGGRGSPPHEGGPRLVTGSADSSLRTASTSGWMPGAPGRPRSGSTRRRAMLRSKGRILYDSCEGVPGNLAEGTRLRSSGRSCGACQAAPRDYQAQSQLTSSAAEPSCETPPSPHFRTVRPARASV